MRESPGSGSKVLAKREMPWAVVLFVAYSLIFVMYDAFRYASWPFEVPERWVVATGWIGSSSYLFSLLLLLSSMLQRHFWKRSSAGVSTLPFYVRIILALEIVKTVVEYLIWIKNGKRWSYNPYLSFSYFRVIWSVLVPSTWIWVWSTKDVKAYFNPEGETTTA